MHQFGTNVRLTRLARQTSLQQLSDASGVSRTMLSEVERGLKVPTIDVASKIADALEVDLLTLLGNKKRVKAAIVREQDRPLIASPNNMSRIWLISPPIPRADLDFALVLLPAGENLHWPYPHLSGTGIYILITQGRLQVRLDHDDPYCLEQNDLLYFDGCTTPEIHNPGPQDCQYYFIIDYPRDLPSKL